ncbi:adenylate/guanylate cyclase domain-containing protein [Robiginitalea sp. IMCC44478]|uniref:adenylate/guanylate cyclase domain-containing protein n=1 Tax=Robiginitalea sp. IMCC44478 TaxID=3459122 RepID=UPI004042F388
MEDNQRLSTIVFGDIKGYTALMQEDEARAMSFLQVFKSELEEWVPSFSGQIVQYFGDACLLSFESTSQAVRCVIRLQSLYRERQLPVRFGIHLGEVIFTEDNVFGDGVNVASRIESMGVAGGILVSKTVKDQLVNKPEFSLKSMGSFDFKNVEEPLEVFAVANEGIVVPRRDELQGKFKPPVPKPAKWTVLKATGVLLAIILAVWYFKPEDSVLSEEQRISSLVVLPFENKTQEAGLDAFGNLISDWLTGQLMETGQVNILRAENLQKELAEAGISPLDIPERFSNSGIGMLITGRYYMEGDQLYVQPNIVDTRTGLVVYSPKPVIGREDGKSDILEALTQEILGFWEVRNTERYRQKPPQFGAYREYLAGVEDFNKYFNEEIDLSEREAYLLNSEVHFLRSNELDSTFLSPLLKLSITYHNLQRYREKDSMHRALEGRRQNFTIWEQHYYDFVRARSSLDWLRAGQIAEAMFRMDPSDEVSFSRAEQGYMSANYQQKAIDLRQSYDSLVVVADTDDPLHPTDFVDFPLFLLREMDSVYNNFQKYPLVLERPWKNTLYTLVLIHTGRYEEIGERVLVAPDQGLNGKGPLLINICNTLLLKGQDSLARVYAGQLKDYAGENKEDGEYHVWAGNAEMILENYTQAAAHLESYVQSIDLAAPGMFYKQDVLGDLVACYAYLGQTGNIDRTRELVPEGPLREALIAYSNARAQAIMGNDDKAIEMLAAAVRLGFPFQDEGFYSFDHHFRPLFDDPRFKSIVAPKG